MGYFIMKKIALITDGWKRYVTYAWVEGYRRFASERQLDTDLHIFQSFGKKRFLAYKKILEKHGIPFETQRVIDKSYEIEAGIQAFSEFQQKDLLPDAFVCASDNIAVGICLAAREAGFSVPEDFFVTGFDNEDKASYCTPRITTAGFSKAEIMYNAMQLLSDIWDGKSVKTHTHAQVTHVFQLENVDILPEIPDDTYQNTEYPKELTVVYPPHGKGDIIAARGATP